MLSIASNIIRSIKTKVHEVRTRKSRSPHWDYLRDKFLTWHPFCSACGGREKLNVHHVMPFQLVPEMELDSDNLMTLCMAKDKHCHLLIGHGNSYSYYNPNARNDAREAFEARRKKNYCTVKDIELRARRNRKKDLPNGMD